MLMYIFVIWKFNLNENGCDNDDLINESCNNWEVYL